MPSPRPSFATPLRVAVTLGAGLLAVACGGSSAADGAAGEPEPASAIAGKGPPPSAAGAEVAVDDILLITIDTLRADALGFAGNPRAATPTLDRLAAAGRVYTRAHAHNVVTLPSHANILTGRLPYEHGVRDNSGFVLPETIPTAATLLAEAGFATAAVVGAFPLDGRFGLDRGFELYDDRIPRGSKAEFVPAERRGDEVVRRGLDWWRSHRGQRRFLWLHLFDPHAPYEPPGGPSAAPYLGEVAAVDGYLAPILEPFLAGGEPPALVVFTADHGEALGDHGEMTHGLFAYESTLRVPLVLWAPGLPAGRVAESVSHVDLLPTLLEATGVEAPPGLAGRSLLGPPPAAPPPVYFESLTPALDRGWAPLTGVVEGGFKLISLPIPELYDLEADPGETENLYAAEPERARRMAARLPEEAAWPPRRGEVSAETEAALRALGYLGGGAPEAGFTVADDPKNLVHLDRKMHRVVDLYSRGRLDEAGALAQEVVRERDDLRVAWYYLAQVLLEQERLGEAIAVMSEARRRDAASPALARQLALSLAAAGRAEAALEVAGPMAESRDPEDLVTLGAVLSEAGRQPEAARALERALAEDPGSGRALANLALVALRGRAWPEAERRARSAVEADPELGPAWNYLGTALYSQGRAAEALPALARAVELEPANYDALYNLAAVALELGDRATARSAIERFLEQAPPERYGSDLETVRGWLRGLG